MGTEIIYFSGTGNSLHVAKELCRRLPDAWLRSLLGLLGQEVVTSEAEAVGFVFPQYASTMPKVVHDVLRHFDPEPARYLFAIATRGGTDCFAFHELDALLAQKSRRLDAYFVLTMPSGSSPLVKAFPETTATQRIEALESDMLSRLDTIQGTIAERRTHRDEDTRSDMPPPVFLKPLIPLIRRITPALIQLGKQVERRFDFYVDDKCAGCGVCAQVCLADRIQLVGGKPQWPAGAACYGCFACLNYCPRHAVQIRSSWYLKSHTLENGRYHHPQVTARDIAAQKAARRFACRELVVQGVIGS